MGRPTTTADVPIERGIAARDAEPGVIDARELGTVLFGRASGRLACI